MKGIFPIISIIVAGALFFWYVDPTYKEVQSLRAEEATLSATLSRALELQQTRDQLLSRYNTFTPTDLARIEKMLPDHVDNVRLVLDMDGIASVYGMRVRNVAIDNPQKNQKALTAMGPDESSYESVVLSFTVTGQYDTFRTFMADLERSLRLVDIEGISFSATDAGLYDYTVALRTYWLKP